MISYLHWLIVNDLVTYYFNTLFIEIANIEKPLKVKIDTHVFRDEHEQRNISP